MTDARLLRFARELEADDDRLARSIAEVRALAADVDELRSRADALLAFLERLPATQAEVGGAAREAEAELQCRRVEVARAEATLGEVEGGDDREAVAAARRDVTSARDAAASAERRAERARAAAEDLAREAATAGSEGPEVDRRAHELAERMHGLPRTGSAGGPEPGLAGAAAWGARARGALLLARSALESERERVVRQANELLSSVSGDAAPAASVALVRQRLEALP